MNIEKELEILKEFFDIEFLLTVQEDMIKGYNKGKIYLDSMNCLELAEALIKISDFLESHHPNHEQGPRVEFYEKKSQVLNTIKAYKNSQ